MLLELLSALLLPLGYFFAQWSAVSSSAPIVDLNYAQYQGSWNVTSNVTSFLGVRYAAPPTGDLRFSAPQAPSPTTGIQQATSYSNYCYQTMVVVTPETANLTGSEDCLFLNVYTPGSNLDASLPVVVWIHGGGYAVGEGAWHNGADLVHGMLGGAVAVVLQYRLGIFGFLPGKAVHDGGSLNAGLLDQRFAFEWIQKNIHKFGGDPTRVTIWGESAGAGSVLQHVVADGGNTQPPLFHAALASSPFVPSQYWYNDTVPEEFYTDVVATANCSAATDSLACLRSLDSSALDLVNWKLSAQSLYTRFRLAPVIDGSFIVESPSVTLADGRHNGKALIATTTADEGYIFVDQSNSNLIEYISYLFPLLSPEQVKGAADLYASVPDTTVADQCTLINGEVIFVCPSYKLLRAFGNTGYRSVFAVPPGYHGTDIVYYFTSYNVANSSVPASQKAFQEAFVQSFGAMVLNLDPNDKLNKTDPTPAWAPWSTSGHTEMIFNVTESGSPDIYTTVTDAALLERCAYWDSLYQVIGQ